MIGLLVASTAVVAAAIILAALLPPRGTVAFLLAVGLLAQGIVVLTVGAAGLVIRNLSPVTLVLASLWFHVPIKGSLLLLYVLSLAFFFSTLGLGALISTVSKTFQQATQVAQLVLLPSILISGFIFPRESLPYALQWLGGLLPLTYFVIVIRGILIKGVGIEYLWHQILPMMGLGVLVFALAIRRFQKRID